MSFISERGTCCPSSTIQCIGWTCVGSRELIAEQGPLYFSSFNWILRLESMSLSWSHCSLNEVILSLSALICADSSWFCCFSHATSSRASLCSIKSLDLLLSRCVLK